jgi:hypothetical protein
MIGMMALCWTAEGLSKPKFTKYFTVAINAPEKFLLEPHGLKGRVDFEGFTGLNFDVNIVEFGVGLISLLLLFLLVFRFHCIFQNVYI